MENNLVHQTVRGDPWRGVLKDPLMTGTRQGKKMRERERERETDFFGCGTSLAVPHSQA